MVNVNKYNNEDRIKLILKGVENGDYPETLFKYREIERAMQILKDCTFRFSSPARFNDPFDCSLDEVLKYDRNEISNWLDVMFSSESSLNNSEKLKGINKNDVIDALLNDEDNLVSIVNEYKNKAINSRGVLSLSKKVNEILLWSHYAGNQSGVAIELELKKDPSFFLMPRNMNYVDSYNPTNYINDSLETINQILSTKFSHWKYEDEVRIYKVDSADKDVKINPEAIKAIYFGVRTEDKDIQSIKKLCQLSHLQHVKFFKGEKVYGQFSIKFIHI
ncbi:MULTISPECIES: DUF2971 domain-containing protein [Serratia]|uniref:DUF2971 domain-containing protein n=1 Tax=Serratia TaxID=613 RepID=UPI0008FFB42D|nr:MULTISPECIES: DUF2971 domain-containing protein [Serratia]AYU91270.1 DUF2971 domain-containing protein [Serratia sp. LS-1]MBH2559900.1 DUF2971 domain-containing protein [Serratia ureilytica]MBH2657558.1 DUF2971 domain-containing protein [Serratia ureilytica]MBH2699941.1 DUF2971 domain-containing protein [Serratia ureilytica]MBH2945844.1 DUF2971 domain-containing protein [Serratia ureilytica]